MPASESFSLLNEKTLRWKFASHAKPEELAQLADKIPCGFYVQAYSARARSLQRSRSQFVTLKRGQNIKYLPYAFTEHGLAAVVGRGFFNSLFLVALGKSFD